MMFIRVKWHLYTKNAREKLHDFAHLCTHSHILLFLAPNAEVNKNRLMTPVDKSQLKEPQ